MSWRVADWNQEFVNDVQHHIATKMAGAELDMIPFPHMLINEFFPSKTYESILEQNPFQRREGRPWLSRTKTRIMRTRTPYYLRKQIDLSSLTIHSEDDDDFRFWHSIRQALLGDHWFEKLVFKKFPSFFLIRYGSLAEMPDFFCRLNNELFLQRHEAGYELGPHTDVPTRVFTCIFSFADREGFERFGTQLLRPVDSLACCWGNDHYGWDSFRVVKVAPYKPNSVLIFFKTRHSFHGVRSIDDSVPNQRYGMQLQVYEPRGGLFRDLSEPHLFQTRHSRLGRLHENLRRLLPPRLSRTSL